MCRNPSVNGPVHIRHGGLYSVFVHVLLSNPLRKKWAGQSSVIVSTALVMFGGWSKESKQWQRACHRWSGSIMMFQITLKRLSWDGVSGGSLRTFTACRDWLYRKKIVAIWNREPVMNCRSGTVCDIPAACGFNSFDRLANPSVTTWQNRNVMPR